VSWLSSSAWYINTLKGMFKKLLLLLVSIAFVQSAKAQSYCAAGPTTTALAEIVRVSIVGSNYNISRVSTACGATGVQDFTTTDSANVIQGAAYTLNVAFGTCSGGATATAGQVWIDWNQNGIFEPTESVGTHAGNSNIFGTTIPNLTVTVNVPVTPFIGRTRMRVMQQGGGTLPLNPCSSFNTGSVEDYTINVIGATPCVTPPVGGVTVISPSLVCPAQPFTVNLNSLSFGNGQSYQWQYSTDSLVWVNMPNQTLPSTTTSAPTTRWFRCQITCGATMVSSSAAKVTVITTALPTGTYTINGNLATGGSNFNSFSDFALSVNCGGIAGPIVVNVISAGVSYNEKVAFGAISGSSATNTITIKGNSQTISSGGGAPQYATLLFNGTQHVKVNKLNVNCTTTSNSFGIQLTGNAQYLEFDSCTVSLPLMGLPGISAAFVASGSLTSATAAGLSAQDIIVKNSTFNGGYYGFCFIGPTTAPFVSNNLIENNAIRNFGVYGMYISNLDISILKGNDINRAQLTGSMSTFYGIYISGSMTGVHVVGNKVHKPSEQNPTATFTTYPLYFTSANASATNPLLVANNVVYDLFGRGAHYGVYLASGNHINFYHNTINLDNGTTFNSSTTQQLFHSIATSGTFQIKNNIFQMTHAGLSGSKYLINLASAAASYNINHNQYYIDGSGGPQNYFGRYAGSNATTLAAWQALNNGAFDSNGVQGDAIFNATNYTPESSVGDNMGANLLSIVPDDLNGAARTTTPDIGAVEFYPPTCFEPTMIGGIATSTSIFINWINDSDADSVRIEYGLSGFVQGNGTFLNVTDTSHTFTGLPNQTCYDFYFRTWCGDTLGLSHALFSLCTECGQKPMPFIENFDSIVASNNSAIPGLPPCWKYYKSPSHTGYAYTYTFNSPKSPLNHARFNSGTTLNDTLAIISPALQGLTAGNKQVTFWAKSSTSTYNQRVIVGTVASPNQMHTLVIIDTVIVGQSYAERTVYFNSASGYNGTHAYVVFMQGAFSLGQSLYLDNIEFAAIPLCSQPTALLASNITATSAQISWSTVLGTSFKVAYGPTGFVPGGSQGTVVNPATAPTTLIGLTPNTNYDVYVADNCNPSIFTGPHTFKTNCVSILNGVYTVGGLAAPNNFPTLDSVFEALADCGISGPVTINLQGGTFLIPNTTIESISGASAINTITINGGGPTLDTIRFGNSTSAGFDFSGAAYITFQNLTIYGENSANLIWLHNNAHHLTWDNCALVANLTASNSSTCVIGASNIRNTLTAAANNANQITFNNCKIRGGYYGITVYGTSQNNYVSNFIISNNVFEDQYYYGVRMFYVDSIAMDGNTISDFRNTTARGFHGVRISRLLLRRNKIFTPIFTPTTGIYINYLNNQSTSATSEISNNFSGGNSFGINLDNYARVNIWHNSFRGTTNGFRGIDPGPNVDIRNNIFVGNSDYAFYNNTNPTSGYTLNHNLYFSNSGFIAYNGAGFATLAAWQSAQSAHNANSLQGDPGFVSTTDFHITGALPNGAGVNGLLSVDIDGDPRPLPASIFVDLGADEYTPQQNDVSLLEIIEPINQSCGDSNMIVKVVFMNIGSQPATNVSAAVNIAGAISTSISAAYPGTLPSFAVDTIVVSSFNSAAGGTFTLDATLVMLNDQDTSNNTLVKTIQVNDILPRLPQAALDSVCVGGFDALYYPTNTARMDFQWLTTMGDTIGTADSIVVGPLGASDTTFMLRAIPAQVTVGPLDNSIGLMANYTAMNRYMQFTVNMATTLYSVDVYAATAGLVDVVIQDGITFEPLYTHTVAVAAGGWQTLVLNRDLTPGTYRMGGTSVNNAGGLQCNFSGAQYPYLATDSSVTITGNTYDPAYYYFFYNWQLFSINCPRPDGSVTIFSRNALSASFNANINAPTLTGLSVDFNASASANATTYNWIFGDGNTGTGAVVSHIYLQNGTYPVTLMITGACGSDTTTQQIVVSGIGFEESRIGQTLKLYPNPNNGLFRVEFEVEGLKEVEIRVMSLLGQTVYQSKPGNVSGSYREEIDLSSQAAGVYILQVISEDGTVSRRVTVRK
jgi:hypothetical protein